LIHPFPQQQSLVAKHPAPPQGGNLGHPANEDASSSAHIYMFNGVYLTTRTMTYDIPPGKPSKENVTNRTASDPPSTLVIPPFGALHIGKPNFDSILCRPKRTIKNLTFNPNSHAAQNYNIVKDLAQVHCAMSILKVIQHFPRQHRTSLEVIRAIDHE
jgi:hypothetical protein